MDQQDLPCCGSNYEEGGLFETNMESMTLTFVYVVTIKGSTRQNQD
jgi:hypothetical protein